MKKPSYITHKGSNPFINAQHMLLRKPHLLRHKNIQLKGERGRERNQKEKKERKKENTYLRMKIGWMKKREG